MIQRAVFLLLALSIAAQWGCSSRLWADSKETATDTYNYVFDQEPTTQTFHEAAEVPIMEYNYRAADELYSNLDGDELSDESSVFVSRFTNQTDPGDNAVFGYVMTRQVMDLAAEICGGRLVLVHEGGYSEAYVPFCGHAVMEQLSGSSTRVPDPMADTVVARQPGPRFDAFLDDWIADLATGFGT